MKTSSQIFKPSNRQLVLADTRRLKMARSAHSYVRGNTLKFYEWLASSSGKSIPQGPPVWICGDCHVGNLGPVADATGRVQIAIRDLDQTVIGNPAHDLIRLGLFLATNVTVTALQPGPTDTDFFHRAGMDDTQVGSEGKKESTPEDVAKQGIEALLAGKDHVYAASVKTKIEGMIANAIPGSVKAAMHEKMAKPKTAGSK